MTRIVEILVLFAMACILFVVAIQPGINGPQTVLVAAGVALLVSFGFERLLRHLDEGRDS